MVDVYIRPLRIGDHKVSYKWRNNPEIWELTGSSPDVVVTDEVEKAWVMNAMKEPDTIRRAICISESDEYVGNVQLTNIKEGEAEFHIFIGATEYWGQGIATSATRQIIEVAFEKDIYEIYLYVKRANKKAISVYRKCGFKTVQERSKVDPDSSKMAIVKPG